MGLGPDLCVHTYCQIQDCWFDDVEGSGLPRVNGTGLCHRESSKEEPEDKCSFQLFILLFFLLMFFLGGENGLHFMLCGIKAPLSSFD